MSATIRSPNFPLSPSSPSENDLKSESAFTIAPKIPQSPVSPPLMSVATKSYVSSYGNNQHTDEMAQRPRSPTTNYVQQSQRMNSTFTPQEQNLKRSNSSSEEHEHRDKRQKVDAEADRMEIDSTPARTIHATLDESSVAMSQNESLELQMSKQSMQSSSTSVGTMRQDLGEAYLLCKSSVPRSRPDPKEHLLAVYGLTDLLKSVARTDPSTGEKINKLRKSYEGQIKTFGLSGRNKPVKSEREEDQPGPLRSLAMVQDTQWDAEQGKTKIHVDDSLRAKLQRAMQIQPGVVRNNAHWEDVLGHEKPRGNTQPQPAPPPRIPNGVPRPQGSSAADKRATRGNKRSYGDDSFSGYGEGFSDADDVGDGDEEYSGRKRKKDSSGQSNR